MVCTLRSRALASAPRAASHIASKIGYAPSVVSRPGITITSSAAVSAHIDCSSSVGSGPHTSMKQGGCTASTGSASTTHSESRPVIASATAVRKLVNGPAPGGGGGGGGAGNGPNPVE